MQNSHNYVVSSSHSDDDWGNKVCARVEVQNGETPSLLITWSAVAECLPDAGCVLQYAMLHLSSTCSGFVYLLFERPKWGYRELRQHWGLQHFNRTGQMIWIKKKAPLSLIRCIHKKKYGIPSQKKIAGIVSPRVITARLHGFCCKIKVQTGASDQMAY